MKSITFFQWNCSCMRAIWSVCHTWDSWTHLSPVNDAHLVPRWFKRQRGDHSSPDCLCVMPDSWALLGLISWFWSRWTLPALFTSALVLYLAPGLSLSSLSQIGTSVTSNAALWILLTCGLYHYLWSVRDASLFWCGGLSRWFIRPANHFVVGLFWIYSIRLFCENDSSPLWTGFRFYLVKRFVWQPVSCIWVQSLSPERLSLCCNGGIPLCMYSLSISYIHTYSFLQLSQCQLVMSIALPHCINQWSKWRYTQPVRSKDTSKASIRSITV